MLARLNLFILVINVFCCGWLCARLLDASYAHGPFAKIVLGMTTFSSACGIISAYLRLKQK